MMGWWMRSTQLRDRSAARSPRRRSSLTSMRTTRSRRAARSGGVPTPRGSLLVAPGGVGQATRPGCPVGGGVEAAPPQEDSRAGRVGEGASPDRPPRVRAATRHDCVGDHGKSARALGAALRERGHRAEVEAVIDDHFDDLANSTCVRRAAQLLGRPRATHYRRCQPPKLGHRPLARRR